MTDFGMPLQQIETVLLVDILTVSFPVYRSATGRLLLMTGRHVDIKFRPIATK